MSFNASKKVVDPSNLSPASVNVHVERLLEQEYQFGLVERIGPQIIDKPGLWNDLGAVTSQVLDDDVGYDR